MIDIRGYATWRSANAQWLGLSLERLRLRLNRRMLWLQSLVAGESRALDWLVATGSDAERRFHESDPASKAIDEMIALQDTRLGALERRMGDARRGPALRSLAELAGLSPLELDVLLLAAAPALDGAFARAYAELNDDPHRAYATLQIALGLSANGPIERVLAADALMPTAALRALRLVEMDEDGADPVLTRRIRIDERVCDHVRGVSRLDTRLLPFLREVRGSIAGDAIDRAAEQAASMIAGETRHWTTINLVGTIDGGAREVAERACAAVGTRLLALDIVGLAAASERERPVLLALLGREALLGGFALVIDTARAERGTATAAMVDDVIELVAATLFVVSADRWSGQGDAHQAARVVLVTKPTRSEQRALWRSALAGREHSISGELDTIVEQFDFGPGAIAAAVTRAGGAGVPITPKALWRSCREEIGAALDELADRIAPCYGWDDIVVGSDVRAQLRELADQVELRGRVYETWGFGARLGRGRGITALFAGASGTGKTMAAEILAAHLDLDLYRIDLAGVVSKYIGETEKNLRRVFDAAERSGAILFFDEADALFGTRTEVRDSHDRYANVEINYLLQRMEDYAGLAVLATNRRTALDPAFVRRLRFVIEFPIPAAEDRRRIWERVFPQQAELDRVEYGFLSRLELTGGNIRSVAVNGAFLAAAERSPVTMNHLVRAAAREYAKLAKPISATEFGPYYAVARQ